MSGSINADTVFVALSTTKSLNRRRTFSSITSLANDTFRRLLPLILFTVVGSMVYVGVCCLKRCSNCAIVFAVRLRLWCSHRSSALPAKLRILLFVACSNVCCCLMSFIAIVATRRYTASGVEEMFRNGIVCIERVALREFDRFCFGVSFLNVWISFTDFGGRTVSVELLVVLLLVLLSSLVLLLLLLLMGCRRYEANTPALAFFNAIAIVEVE